MFDLDSTTKGCEKTLDELERVSFEGRIEKRLASLMRDLAEHKGMTIGEMLEEL